MCERLCWSALLLLMHWNDALGRVPKPTWSSDSADVLQTTYLRTVGDRCHKPPLRNITQPFDVA
jgi:hypothetical protein